MPRSNIPLPIFTGSLAWIRRSECSKQDIDINAFFPKKKEMADYAIRVCSHCPVIANCYEYAKENNEKSGVWGGINFGGLAGRPKRNAEKLVIY